MAKSLSNNEWVTFDDVNSAIEKLREHNRLSAQSIDFLEKKLNRFKENDWVLDEYEKSLLEKQISFHKMLKSSKSIFIKSKSEFTNRSQAEILELYNEKEWSNIDMEEIDEVRRKIDNEINKVNSKWMGEFNYRDYIINNLVVENSIKAVSWLWDTKMFYDKFVVFYLNYLESKYSEEEISKNHTIEQKWLLLNPEELQLLVIQFTKINTEITASAWKKLEVKLRWSDEITIDIDNILLIIDKEKSANYAEDLFNKSINNPNDEVINSKIKDTLWIKKEYTNKELQTKYFQFIVNEDFLSKQKLLGLVDKLSPENNKYLIEKNKITKSELLIEFEKNKKFNYEDFLDEYGLTEIAKESYIKMLKYKLLWKTIYINKKRIKITGEFIKSNFDYIISNYNVVNKMIINMESKWKNTPNLVWESSSNWYYQFLTWNWYTTVKNGKETIHLSSTKTALRRIYTIYSWIDPIYVRQDQLEYNSDVPKWVVDAFNDPNFNVINLSAERQSILFTVERFWSDRRLNWSSVRGYNYLIHAILWNTWWIKKFYLYAHHTWWSNADENTIENMKRWITKYSDELKLLY